MFNIAEYSNLTKEERMYYDASLKRDWDNHSALETAKQDSEAKGKLEGKIEGRIEGKIEGKIVGKIEGKIEGKHEQALETARKMKLKHYSVEEIIEMSGLSAEEIEKI